MVSVGGERKKIVGRSVRTLTLRLLGPGEVLLDGQPVKFPTRKTFALLAFLAVEPARHPRERITALLWPDANDARANLRTTLAYLRESLGERVTRVYLDADRTTLGLERSAITVDLDAITHALSSTGIEALESAASHCRGLFLEGLVLPDAPEFEEWLVFQREYWRRQVNSLFERLTREQLDRGDARAAVRTAERWHRLDPLDEPGLRRLVEALICAGDQAGAQRVFEAGRQRFERELGVTLQPATFTLAERVRTRPRSAPGSDPISRFEAAFVGRQAEHLQMVSAYHAIKAGAPRILAIEGEAGIGKTRLAEEFLAWATAQGADVLRGGAFAAPHAAGAVWSHLPYVVFVRALRDRLERENAPDDLVGDVWLAELGRILPELHDRYPDLPRAFVDPGVGPGRLFEAVSRMVHALAERSPVVVFIDDAQWADSASLDLLGYAARRWHELHSRVLVLITLRDDSPPDWLGGLERDVEVEHIALGPLDTTDVLQWLGIVERGPDPDGEAFGRWLFSETRGHPLFIGEIVKMLVKSGVLAETPAGFDFAAALRRETELRGVLPPRIREIVRARVLVLGSAARDLLAAASVLGPRIEFDLVWRMAGQEELQALDALEELLANRLLRPAVGSTYAFSHDKIRESVYAHLSDARRQVLHRRAFELLEPRGSASAAELAGHARTARLVEPAFRYALAAGDAALDLFAVSDAIDHFAAARSLLAETAVEANTLEHLFDRLGRAYELAADAAAARDVYTEMLRVARDRQHESMECLALNRLATITAHREMDLAAALGLLDAAQRIAERSGVPRDRAETEWNLAQVHYFARGLTTARVHAEQALALARQLGQTELIARALNIAAYVYFDLGDLSTASDAADEARSLYARIGNRALEVDCLCQLASVLACSGQLTAAIEYGRRARAVADDIGNAWAWVFASYHLGSALLSAGQLDEAYSLFQDAAKRAPGRVSRLLQVLCRNALGIIERERGNVETALAIHLDNLQENQFVNVSLPDVCADLAVLGRWTEAGAYAARAADFADLMPAYLRVDTLRYEVEALMRADNRTAAERSVRCFESLAGSSPRYRIALLCSRAIIARFAGNPVQARSLLLEALALATALGLPLARRDILALLGRGSQP